MFVEIDGQDSVIIDAVTTVEAVASQQAKLAQLTSLHGNISGNLKGGEALTQRLNSVTSDLAEVKVMADNISERTEPSIVEVMVQGRGR